MGKSIKISASNLVDEFYKEYEYESKNGKFLLFDLANANENANTKVLKHLLQYNDSQFLKSFLNRMGLPALQGAVTVTDQKKAIGPMKTGFIDLYIQYDDVHIIIENKIYGAADTEKQLARYIATVNDIKADEFETWYANPSVRKDTYVVYLTADGTKEPTEDSLPRALQELVKYYRISYADEILPWLETEVMPNIPYAEDGMMIAGLRQYIAFLKQLLTDERSVVVENYIINSLNGQDDILKYEALLNAIGSNHEDVPENVLKSLRKNLENQAEAIFNGDVDGEWVLHFTLSFVFLYKKTWAALDTRKYSIPSLCLVGSTKEFLKTRKFNTFSAKVDHLPAGTPYKYNVKAENHGKTAVFDLSEKVRGIECDIVNDKASREQFYKDIIYACEDAISQMDKAVAQVINNGRVDKPQIELLKHLSLYINTTANPIIKSQGCH